MLEGDATTKVARMSVDNDSLYKALRQWEAVVATVLFHRGLTLEEVGGKLGMSRERVLQIIGSVELNKRRYNESYKSMFTDALSGLDVLLYYPLKRRHGNYNCYQDGCRCQKCKSGHADYVRQRRQARAYRQANG